MAKAAKTSFAGMLYNVCQVLCSIYAVMLLLFCVVRIKYISDLSPPAAMPLSANTVCQVTFLDGLDG